ncbi:hypothetical protein ACVWWR_002037 [Bradyrhizobium sp. LM3.2]
MGDQRVLCAIADLGPIRHGRHLAALVGGLFQVFQVVQADAVKRARDQRQLDLDLRQRMRARGALPFAKRIAGDRDHLVALDDSP